MKNVLSEFFNYIQKQDTKIAKEVYNWLNYDNLGGIIIYDNVYWLEKTISNITIPNYVFDYIESYMKKKGYKHLYVEEAII